LMRSSIFILVTNLAEQHNMVTLKQSSDANQLTQRDKPSLVRFEKVQGRLPFTCFPLLQASPVQCTQSHYFITRPRISICDLFTDSPSYNEPITAKAMGEDKFGKVAGEMA
jgi:hypothetical protein